MLRFLARFITWTRQVATSRYALLKNHYVAHLVSAVLACLIWKYGVDSNLHLRPLLDASALVGVAIAFLWKPLWTTTLLQYAMGVYLLLTFYENTEAQTHAIPRLLLTGLLLVVYLLAEAFEIAVTQLRAKESDRIPEIDQKLMDDIDTNFHLFYDTREWLVVGLVIGLTFLSDFPQLILPFHQTALNGDTASVVRVVFSLLFTTVVVVWIAQSPAKISALDAPLVWLEICGRFWKPLKWIGFILQDVGLFTPAKHFGRFIDSVVSPPAGLARLQPSQQAFYNTCLKRYGYSLHELKENLTIHNSGGGQYTQEGLIYIVSGNRRLFSRWFQLSNGICLRPSGDADAEVLELKAWEVPNFSERISRSLTEDLDKLFRDNPQGDLVGSTGTLHFKNFGLTYDITTSGLGGAPSTERLEVLLKSPKGLPEELINHRDPNSNRAVAIRFKVVVQIKAGCFDAHQSVTNRDHHARLFDFPCRLYTCEVMTEASLGSFQFGNPEKAALIERVAHPAESSRIEADACFDERKLVVRVDYPMPGVEYRVTWPLWKIK